MDGRLKIIFVGAVLVALILGAGTTVGIIKTPGVGYSNQYVFAENVYGGNDHPIGPMKSGNAPANFITPDSTMSTYESSSPAGVFYTTQQLAAKVAQVRHEPRIAFVDYTFTKAAYSTAHFYTFYNLYVGSPTDKAIRNNLQMLTAPVPIVGGGHGEAAYFASLSASGYPAQISIIDDKGVNDGVIFNQFWQE